MFKTYIINILLLVLTVSVTLSSCDGRKTRDEALKESIQKFRDSITPVEIVEYIPKEYSEVVTDTILSNGFSVSIKTFTDMKRSVSHKYKIDSFTIQTNIYREWISEVKVKKDGKLIFNATINDDFFIKNDKNLKSDLSESVNIGTTLGYDFFKDDDENIYLYSRNIYLDISSGITYIIIINKKGEFILKKLFSS